MASIQGIYIALFGRPADPAGLTFFNQATGNGSDLTAIGDLTATAEYQARFSGLSNEAIINSIYQSLFGRSAEADGLAFFLAELEAGRLDIGNIAIAILDGAQGDDLANVNAKIAAADLFTSHLDLDGEIAAYVGNDAAAIGRAFLSGVNANNPATAADVDSAILGIQPDQGQIPGSGGGGGGPALESFSITHSHGDLTNSAAGPTLYAGGGNPATGMTRTLADGDNKIIELALDARLSGDATDLVPANTEPDGTEVYRVTPGADVRFAYSAGVSPETGSVPIALDKYDYTLRIDTDATSATNFVELKLATQNTGDPYANVSNSPYEWVSADGNVVITDDGGNGSVSQNIQAFQWYNGGHNVASGDNFEVQLQAFYKGSSTLIGQTAIKIVGASDASASGSHTLASIATQDQNNINMLVGGGNSAGQFAIVSSPSTGIELGLSGRNSHGAVQDGVVSEDGLVHFEMGEGANVRFAYSIASTDGDKLSANVFKLKIDVDSSEATSFVELALKEQNTGDPYTNVSNSPYEWMIGSNAVIIDDGGNDYVTQNVQNIGWYDQVDGSNLAAGQYDVILEAYSSDGLTLIGQNHVVIDVIIS